MPLIPHAKRHSFKRTNRTIADTPPPAITLTTPPDQATDVVVNPYFSWVASPATEQYIIQVATTPAFTNIVYEAAVRGQTHRYDSSLTRLETDTIYYWRVLSKNSCGQTTSPTNQFHTATTLSVLLVDDDWGGFMSLFSLGQNVDAAYVSAMNHQGTYYDYWDVEAFTGTEPDETALSQYDAIIWFSGDAYNFLGFGQPLAGPNEQSEAALASYLTSGRCLLLSSQEYFYDSGLTPFMETTLGVESIKDDAGATFLTGVSPVFDAIGSFPINGTPVFGIADPDIVRPRATANIGIIKEDQESVAIYRDDNYQTLFLGFDLFDIDPTQRMLIIDTFLQWCRPQKEFTPPSTNLPALYLPLVTNQ